MKVGITKEDGKSRGRRGESGDAGEVYDMLREDKLYL